MRGSLLASMALASGALLFSVGASAFPIHVGLKDASGSTQWTSPTIGGQQGQQGQQQSVRAFAVQQNAGSGHGTVSLSGWEYDQDNSGGWAWDPATMIYNDSIPNQPGLGITCNQQPVGNTCGQNQIGSVPWQMIDMDISAMTGWTGLTINVGSVDTVGSTSGNAIAYLLGATCEVGGPCQSTVLASCASDPNQADACSFDLSYAELLGFSHIWIASSATNPDGGDVGNILLGTDLIVYTVPEPAALGVFGFGLLLLGAFVGLRRRRAC